MRVVLYRVQIGEDVYLGTAEEVVAFMARGEGAPGHDLASYMEGVAARVKESLGIDGIRTSEPAAFLDSLDERRVLRVETLPEPSTDRVDPQEALGDDPVGLGKGVDPEDLDL